MRLALIADIHANREAFEAVLAHIRARGVDRIALLGDIVGYGPDPAWCCDKAAELLADGAIAIMGNHDAAVSGDGAETMNSIARAAVEWTRTQLDRGHRAFLEALPMAWRGEDLLLVHASANHPRAWDYVRDERSAERCFRAAEARITCVGHTHVPRLWRLSSAGRAMGQVPASGIEIPLTKNQPWLGVIGSAGQPRDGIPGAACAILDTEHASLCFERVDYDHDHTARKVREAGLPLPLAERLITAR